MLFLVQMPGRKKKKQRTTASRCPDLSRVGRDWLRVVWLAAAWLVLTRGRFSARDADAELRLRRLTANSSPSMPSSSICDRSRLSLRSRFRPLSRPNFGFSVRFTRASSRITENFRLILEKTTKQQNNNPSHPILPQFEKR